MVAYIYRTLVNYHKAATWCCTSRPTLREVAECFTFCLADNKMLSVSLGTV